MGIRAGLVVGTLGFALLACGAGSGGSSGGPSTAEPPGTGTDTNATTPSPPESDEAPTPARVEEPSGPPATLKLAPTCGIPGYRVVLTLGLTRDRRVPSCIAVDDASVTFAPGKPGKITLMGPTSDGFCALDVEIPKGAETGKVQVAIGKDTFESDVLFGIPCP